MLGKNEKEPLGHEKNITRHSVQHATDDGTVKKNSEDQWEQCFVKMMRKLNEGEKNEESMIFSLYLDEPGKTIKMYGKTSFRMICMFQYTLLP